MAQADGRTGIDWSVLRGALGILAISMLVSALLVGGSQYFRGAMEREYRTNHNRFMSISSQYLSVDDQERIVRTLYPRFLDLHGRGVIGAEQRLAWIETLRAAAEATGLPSLRYSIDSRAEYTPDFTVETGSFQIYASAMQLDLGLAHEGDLLQLLAALDHDAPGLYRIDRCSLKRAAASITTDLSRPNLVADCDLSWFTLNLAGGEEIKP